MMCRDGTQSLLRQAPAGESIDTLLEQAGGFGRCQARDHAPAHARCCLARPAASGLLRRQLDSLTDLRAHVRAVSGSLRRSASTCGPCTAARCGTVWTTCVALIVPQFAASTSASAARVARLRAAATPRRGRSGPHVAAPSTT